MKEIDPSAASVPRGLPPGAVLARGPAVPVDFARFARFARFA